MKEECCGQIAAALLVMLSQLSTDCVSGRVSVTVKLGGASQHPLVYAHVLHHIILDSGRLCVFVVLCLYLYGDVHNVL